MKNNVKMVAVGSGAFVVGAFVGFVVSNAKAQLTIKKGLDKIEAKYTEELDELSTSFQDVLDKTRKTGPYATPQEAAAVLIPEEDFGLNLPDDAPEDSAEDGFDDDEEVQVVPDDTPIVEPRLDPQEFMERFRNRIISPEPDDEEVEDEEEVDDEPIPSVPGFTSVRNPNGPYVISIDEFMEETDDSPFQKIEMTYFEGDGVLIDSRKQIVPDIAGTVGSANLHNFGVGTTDKDQVYIRNERLEIDIEVTRDDQTYTRTILGIPSDEDVRRSMTKPKKMREGDDN